MNGRRRRVSTSSVETVDDSQIRWQQEASVIRSAPEEMPVNDRPLWELRDAIVLDKHGQAFENALHVGTRGPFIVRGHLVVEDPEQKLSLIKRFRKSVPIEVRNCISYSIGQSEGDGRPVIWVLGRGGWYEINPSDAYLPIFNKMCEATTMYYHILDICKSNTSKRSKKSTHTGRLAALHDTFLRYATKVGDGSTIDEVVERCAEHASFFVSQFMQDNDELDWKRTGFYQWFVVEHADVFQKYEELIKNPPKLSRNTSIELASPAPRDKSSSVVTRSASVEEMGQRQVQPSQKPAKSISIPRTSKASPIVVGSSPVVPTQPVETIADGTNGDGSPFSSVLAALEHVYDMRATSKRGLTVSKTLNDIYFAHKFPNYKDGTTGCHKIPVIEVLHYNASALLQALDKKYQKHEIYSYLQELASKEFSPVAMKPSAFPYQMVPRKPSQRLSKKSDAAGPPPAIENISSRAKEDDDEADDPPRRMGKTLKRPGRRPGKKATLRTITSSKKRTHAELESESELESEASVLKRSHYFSDGDDDAAMEDPVEDAPVENTVAIDLPQPVEEPIRIVIRAEKIPSTVPQGPDETWTCDQDGCQYVVRGGDDADCQDRIREHFEEHERQTKRLSLAVTESSRGHMPINHLLEKLKKMGEKVQQSQQLSVGGPPLPQPIKRKLIV